jgi:hypothetical protein
MTAPQFQAVMSVDDTPEAGTVDAAGPVESTELAALVLCL